MEEEVGVRLFERNNRAVLLTPGGVLYKQYAEEVVYKWKRLTDDLSTEKKVLSGVINVYCSVTASLSVLPEILKAFHSSYPSIRIKLNTGDAAKSVQQVMSNEADISVAALPDHFPKSLRFKPITETPLLFIAPVDEWDFSEQFVKRHIPWEKIPMIVSEYGLSRTRINAWYRKRRIKPNICAEISGNEAIISMVSLGYGVGIVPELVLDQSPLRNRVSVLDVKPKLEPYIVAVCSRKKKTQSPPIKAFWDSVSL
jgi:LysR family positive regulator for ilvC